MKQLGDILLEGGLLSPIQLEAAYEEQQRSFRDLLLVLVLVLALGYFAFDKFVLAPRREQDARAMRSASCALLKLEQNP